MKFPLFSGNRDPAAIQRSEDRIEKVLAETLRHLSKLCAKLADHMDAQRLARAGYGDQEKFLKRVETPRAAEASGQQENK